MEPADDGDDHNDARQSEGRSRRGGGPRHAHARAWNGNAPAQERHLTGGVDQEKVQHHVGQVGQGIQKQRGPGVARAAEHGRQHEQSRVAGHTQGVQAQVAHRVGQHLRLRAQPGGNVPAQQQQNRQEQETHDQKGQQGLENGAAGLLLVPGTHSVGHLNGIAHAHAGQYAAQQPDRGGVDRHGGGGRFAQYADHGSVHIADHGAQKLLQNGGPCQVPHDPHAAVFWFGQCLH